MAWYAKFDGIDGSASEKLHQGWINCSSVNVGGHKAGGGGTGVGVTNGKMRIADVSIGITSDRSVPKLMEAAVKGRIFRTVEIHGTALSGKDEHTYIELVLEKAQISNYQLGVLDNNPATDDIFITLMFDNYKALYREPVGTP